MFYSFRERDLLVGRLEEEVLKYKKELNTMKNEEKKVNEENGKMATRNGVSFEKKGKHSGVTVSDKQVFKNLINLINLPFISPSLPHSFIAVIFQL